MGLCLHRKERRLLSYKGHDGIDRELEVTRVFEDIRLSPSDELIEFMLALFGSGRQVWFMGQEDKELTREYLEQVKTHIALFGAGMFYFRDTETKQLMGYFRYDAYLYSDNAVVPHFLAFPALDKDLPQVALAFFEHLKELGIKTLIGFTCAKFYHVLRLFKFLGHEEITRLEKAFQFRNKLYDTVVTKRVL